jgi:flagellar biosynthesis/type III secretory pathway chaperone
MSGTDNSQTDQSYFRAIEETFIRLRGTPFLLSPADWQQAKQWRHQGVPLELVLSTLESVFQSRADSGKTGKVQSLRYCAAAVDEAWQQVAELSATGSSAPTEPVDSTRQLQVLVDRLPETIVDREVVTAEILSLSGSTETIEQELMRLDQRILVSAFNAMSDADREAILRQVDSTLADLDRELDRDSLPEIRQRLFDQTVRKVAGLPFLSLFSAEQRD